MSGEVLLLLITVSAGWILFGVTLIRDQRIRNSGRISGLAPVWYRALMALLFLFCVVGSVSLLLLKQGANAEQVLRVLLLINTDWETALLRFGLIICYLLFVGMLIAPGVHRRVLPPPGNKRKMD